ncbi:MAG: hypothetical protein LBR29_00075 [Methylobacteriaceae bacterium]|jgi:poly-gamma-glutamate synthase PgsB/CapB|nr:hypothetical protein [Methylobacteriaceae bacterium]
MVFWICVTLVFGWLVRERLELNRLLRVLTTRVHVFGTRGKTTTTRLLAALFRQNGRTVLGKISGDTPLLIFPDGTEMPLNRRGPANVREYVSCLRRAARSGCDTVVFECMALSPETVVAATGFLKPTHALITNTRPDHHETMGRTPGEIAATLALAARGADAPALASVNSV